MRHPTRCMARPTTSFGPAGAVVEAMITIVGFANRRPVQCQYDSRSACNTPGRVGTERTTYLRWNSDITGRPRKTSTSASPYAVAAGVSALNSVNLSSKSET